MAKGHDGPPRQGVAGQLIDVITLLALTFGALYLPLWMGLAGAGKETVEMANPTWESLGQNAVMQQKWIELGFATPADAAAIINSRFNYTFSWVELLVMAVVVIGYFVLIVRLSDREYRDVIAEKFDGRR
jgi:hypothetical protein